MARFLGLLFLGLGLACLTTVPVQAEETPPAARLHNLKVLSNHIDDITTVDNIRRSFTKPGMSDAERAQALWTAAVKYRHQTNPPDEHLSADWEAHDPVKLLNVYGYCMCCCCSALIEALNRSDGREARGRILNGHSVAEVFHDGGWRMYDSSLITYFPKREGGVASVDELSEAITGWYAKNPGFKGNEAKLRQLMRDDNWSAWKSKGPELLANCPFYTQGWFPAKTHGWYATMIEYDRKCEVYEYGYQLGHQALLSLRPGESFVREAGNRGLHVNSKRLPDWELLKAKAPAGDLVYLKDFLPGYNGGVVANGTHRYAPNLAIGELAVGAEVYDNLASGPSPALRLQAGGKGTAVIPLVSPYVYLAGRVKVKALRQAEADQVTLSLSTNNGRTFVPLWQAKKLGSEAITIELGDAVLRRYACMLKVEIVAADPASAGLDELVIEHDIQHAPRTLPWLKQGANTITVAADADTALATRTVSCRITPDVKFDKNETTATMGAVFDNLDVKDGACWWKQGVGTMTIPIETPGDLAALRFGAQVRARGDKDAVKMAVSFDAGKSWTDMAKITGPTPGRTDYFRFTNIPAKTRTALVRYELSGNNTIGILSFRIDADYRDPLAAQAVRPFEVIHRWHENGQEKTHTQPVDKLPLTYAINTAAVPEMAAVTVRMAGK